MVFQYRHGWRWFHAEASFSLEKLDVEQLYKDVQLLNRLFSKANGKWYFRTDRDVRGSAQQQVYSCKLVAQKCTRMYIF